jgi:hypothetical protein
MRFVVSFDHVMIKEEVVFLSRKKALQDLEFTTVIQQVATFSISELGKKQVLET